MSESGQVIKSISESYPLHFPHSGWAEQEPEDWLNATYAAIQELLQDIDASEVAGLAIAGQMHGLVALDANDRIIRPAILWNDTRTGAETRWLNQTVGEDFLLKHTANIAFPGFTAPKLLWLKQHEPENYARIRRIFLPKDYLLYRLTGIHATDVSDASGTLLFDVRQRKWSLPMLEVCGVDEKWLPAVYESSEPVGALLPKVAEHLGLPNKTLVAAGAGDNAAAAVGTGAVGEGCCNLSIGTSGTLFLPMRQFTQPQNGALHTFCHADGGYHLMGCMLSAASGNQWWLGQILQTNDYEAEQAEIDTAGLGRNEVYYLPYLMGERCPHNDPDVRACFIGMSLDTTRPQLLQAVFEGVGYGLRDALELAKQAGAAPRSATLCGGGARSPLWRRLLANILNLRLELPYAEEGPGYGAAILAAVACGTYPTVEAASQLLCLNCGRVEPEKELAQRYAYGYEKYRLLYPALAPIFNKQEEFNERVRNYEETQH